MRFLSTRRTPVAESIVRTRDDIRTFNPDGFEIHRRGLNKLLGKRLRLKYPVISIKRLNHLKVVKPRVKLRRIHIVDELSKLHREKYIRHMVQGIKKKKPTSSTNRIHSIKMYKPGHPAYFKQFLSLPLSTHLSPFYPEIILYVESAIYDDNGDDQEEFIETTVPSCVFDEFMKNSSMENTISNASSPLIAPPPSLIVPTAAINPTNVTAKPIIIDSRESSVIIDLRNDNSSTKIKLASFSPTSSHNPVASHSPPPQFKSQKFKPTILRRKTPIKPIFNDTSNDFRNILKKGGILQKLSPKELKQIDLNRLFHLKLMSIMEPYKGVKDMMIKCQFCSAPYTRGFLIHHLRSKHHSEIMSTL